MAHLRGAAAPRHFPVFQISKTAVWLSFVSDGAGLIGFDVRTRTERIERLRRPGRQRRQSSARVRRYRSRSLFMVGSCFEGSAISHRMVSGMSRRDVPLCPVLEGGGVLAAEPSGGGIQRDWQGGVY